MNYYRRLLLLLFLATGLTSAQARLISSVKSGDWSDSSTWNLLTMPASGDTIVIQFADTVNVDRNVVGLFDVWLQVYGSISFEPAIRIEITVSSTSIPASMVTFYNGFSLSGGNSASGLSFGSGSSICDLYRPAVGAFGGTYPTVGSYYDGCTWHAFLAAESIWSHSSVEGEILTLEWELDQAPDAYRYHILGGLNDGTDELATVHAERPGEEMYYSVQVVTGDRQYFTVEQETVDGHRKPLFSVAVDQLTTAAATRIYPNPFSDRIYIDDQTDFTVELVSLDGRIKWVMDGSRYYVLKTEDLDPGVYILRLLHDDRPTSVQKLIKR